MDAAGELPADITAQAELAWGHILKMLERAGMSVHDLVKITQYLTRAQDVPAYAKVRARVLGEARPASMLLVVAALPRPQFLLEIEAVAARA
jgi:enamine deaminase RidA (YjgF/YER057c/UK114 family)